MHYASHRKTMINYACGIKKNPKRGKNMLVKLRKSLPKYKNYACGIKKKHPNWEEVCM